MDKDRHRGWIGSPPVRAAIIGASGGIGGALAASLERIGTKVHGFARSASATHGRIDLRNEASIAAAAESLAADGPVDLVIIASGLLHCGAEITPEKSVRQIDGEALHAYFAINSIGPALVAKHFLPLLPRSSPARFAALSARVGSISDNRLGGWHGYRASKAALNMLVRCFAIELARTHKQAICVALHPGTVDTALSLPFQGNVPEGRLFSPRDSAGRLLATLSALGPKDSGGCFDWKGERIPA